MLIAACRAARRAVPHLLLRDSVHQRRLAVGARRQTRPFSTRSTRSTRTRTACHRRLRRGHQQPRPTETELAGGRDGTRVLTQAAPEAELAGAAARRPHEWH
jgi:hypothetical protein